MFGYLKIAAIKAVLEFVLVFMGLTLTPLYLIIWFKKSKQANPAIRLLSRCIKYGQTLNSEECREVNDYLKQIKSSLESFARGTSAVFQDNIILAQAIEVLPLVYEISQPNTCCENVNDGLAYNKGFDCKASLRDLFDELNQTAQLPIISEKLEEIARMKQQAKLGKRCSKTLIILFITLYSAATLMLSQTILFDRASWMVELGIYASCLLVFFIKYDYYCFKIFKPHQKSLKRILKGKT